MRGEGKRSGRLKAPAPGVPRVMKDVLTLQDRLNICDDSIAVGANISPYTIRNARRNRWGVRLSTLVSMADQLNLEVVVVRKEFATHVRLHYGVI